MHRDGGIYSCITEVIVNRILRISIFTRISSYDMTLIILRYVCCTCGGTKKLTLLFQIKGSERLIAHWGLGPWGALSGDFANAHWSCIHSQTANKNGIQMDAVLFWVPGLDLNQHSLAATASETCVSTNFTPGGVFSCKLSSFDPRGHYWSLLANNKNLSERLRPLEHWGQSLRIKNSDFRKSLFCVTTNIQSFYRSQEMFFIYHLLFKAFYSLMEQPESIATFWTLHRKLWLRLKLW